MAVVVDASVGEKALSAKEWLSRSSASQKQQQLPLSSMKENEGILFCGRNSAHEGSVDAGSYYPGMLTSKTREEDGIPPLMSTYSPLMKSKRVNSSSTSNEKRDEGGVPPLTSTCSPLIKSKSSKSSSNQGSLPGLVVAPDGVTMVKDRRKCKPRGILTVGPGVSSFDSDEREEEVALLPMPSPSVATVEWVDESWADMPSPRQSQAEELHLSCSSVNSKSQIESIFEGELGLRPKVAPSVQESYDVRESVEGHPADLIFADSDVSRGPELAHDLPVSGRDSPETISSSKQEHHVGPMQEISPRNHLGYSDPDDHLSETEALDIRLSLDLERQCDDNSLEGGERPCNYCSEMIPREYLTVGKDETHLGNPETGSKGMEFWDSLPLCTIPFEPCDYSSDMIPEEESETISFTVEREENPVENPDLIVSPLSVCSRWLDEHLESEHTGAADAPLDTFTDMAYSQDVQIIRHTHGEGSEIHQAELSQGLHQTESQLSSQVLVAETLYQLAAENLRKTRTEAERFNSPGEKRSPVEAVSSLSIVRAPASTIDTSTDGEHTPSTGAAPLVLSSRVSREITPRQDQLPLRRIVLSHESDFSQEVKTVKTLLRNVHVGAHEDEEESLPATILCVHEEAQGMDQSSLAVSRKGHQRQCRQVSSGYYNKSSFRRAQRRRFSSCSKQVGARSFLAAAAAFGFVVISLAMGSCRHCFTSSNEHYYIRPT